MGSANRISAADAPRLRSVEGRNERIEMDVFDGRLNATVPVVTGAPLGRAEIFLLRFFLAGYINLLS